MAFRQKSFTYSEREKEILTNLVKLHPVIQLKNADSATLSSKNEAWVDIAKSFNAHSEVYNIRTSKQLKKLWSNLKQRYMIIKIN